MYFIYNASYLQLKKLKIITKQIKWQTYEPDLGAKITESLLLVPENFIDLQFKDISWLTKGDDLWGEADGIRRNDIR